MKQGQRAAVRSRNGHLPTTPIVTHNSVEQSGDDERGLERIVFFSDAVFAIAITLLALEIRLPPMPEAVTNGALLAALAGLWPRYLSYMISFLAIGMMWIAHHRAFRHVHRYSERLLLLNILFLLLIGFLPFPTAVIGEYGNAVGTIFYAAAMAAAGLMFALLKRFVNAEGRAFWTPLVFFMSIPLAFWSPDAAKYAWLLIVVPVIWPPLHQKKG